jgi:hypothetical protein
MKNMQLMITALRVTAATLRSDEFPYNWSDGTRCNSGSLACTVLGKAPWQMDQRLIGSGTWSGAILNRTDDEFQSTIQPLLDIGFTRGDLADLEYLENGSIRDRIMSTHGGLPDRSHFTLDACEVPHRWLTASYRGTKLLDCKDGLFRVNGLYSHQAIRENVVMYMEAWAYIVESGRAVFGSTDRFLDCDPKTPGLVLN